MTRHWHTAIAVVTRVAGPFFCLLAVMLILLVVLTYFWDMLPVMRTTGTYDVTRWSYRGLLALHLGISMHLLLQVLYNYAATVLVRPGWPPDAQSLSLRRAPHEPVLLSDTRDSARRRWCRWCNCWKPPRAHHCSVCRRCVLKMDHHCIWMNACVGYRNYRYFLLTLWFLALGCVHTAVTAGFLLFRYEERRTLQANVRVLYCFVMAVAVGAALLVLLLFHVYLVLRGQTTIEFFADHDRTQAGRPSAGKAGAAASSTIGQHRWSLGARTNLQVVFGARHSLGRYLLWPVGPANRIESAWGDGYAWAVRHGLTGDDGNGAYGAEAWSDGSEVSSEGYLSETDSDPGWP